MALNIRLWARGMRLRTLPASIAPVLVGAASAWYVMTAFDGWGLRCVDETVVATGMPGNPCDVRWYAIAGALPRFLGVALLCVGVALLLQIAVNFANDYADGIRGTDDGRGGGERDTGKPSRLVASGLVPPKHVLLAAGIAAVLACACGLAVVVISRQYWLLAVGVLCLIAGWFYTGGRHPYGYAGLGEVAVFIFFGLIATLGTEFAICQSFDGFGIPGTTAFDFAALGEGPWSWVWFGQGEYGVNVLGVLGAICAGINAVLLLMVNNLRDIDSDRKHGKRTLAVRLGERGARTAMAGCCVAALLAAVLIGLMTFPWGLIMLVPCLPSLAYLMRAVNRRRFADALMLAGVYTVLFALAFCIAVFAAAGW